jgi:nicotinate phosphoribosyltransferase
MPWVLYKFKCRNGKDLLPYKKKIENEIKKFMELKFSNDEVAWIMEDDMFKRSFASDLMYANLKDVSVSVFDRDGELHIEIEGPWFPAILFEVPVLAIVNEVYFKGKGKRVEAQKRLVKFLGNTPPFYEFGTRRRRSFAWQEHVVRQTINEGKFLGTSNALIAKQIGVRPIGTMSHQWFQAFQAISRNLRDFQTDALEHWMLTFRGRLGTALTDIVGIDAFLRDLDPLIARNFPVLRHDSGCPREFTDKVEDRYNELNISKPSLMFSDGLNDRTANDIMLYATGHGFNAYSSIGTYATNNWGDEPLQIVIKMMKLNGQDVVKISDTPGKRMSDNNNVTYRLLHTFKGA